MRAAPWLPGDFAVVRSRAAIGGLVRRMQELSGGRDCAYEHVILATGDDLIVEAMPGGAREVPFHYSPADVVWSTGRLAGDADPTWDQREAIVQAARHYAAERVGYSFLDYLAMAAHYGGVPAPGLRAYVASTRHMICSQLADQCYADAGVHLFSDGRWPGYVRPCDLAELIGAP